MSLWSQHPAAEWSTQPWVTYLGDIETHWLALWQEAQSRPHKVLVLGHGPIVSALAHLDQVVVVDVRKRFGDVCAEYHQLPFLQDTFDWVIVAHAHESTEHSAWVLEESLRVTKPEGFLQTFSFNRCSLLGLQKMGKRLHWHWFSDRERKHVLAKYAELLESHPLVHRPWFSASCFDWFELLEGYGSIFFPSLASVSWQIWQKKKPGEIGRAAMVVGRAAMEADL